VPEPAVDPEQMVKSLESALQATQTQAQELLGLQSTVGRVRASQTELTGEKEQLLQQIAHYEAEIAKDRARIHAIDATLGEHKNTLVDLHKTIAHKTKQ
jgi:peptidoglycan hydrolase CwlO-like protein